MLIYYGGDSFPHQGWKRHCLPCLARLRVDGFAGYESSAPGGDAAIITHPVFVTGPIQISADVCPGGALRVSVLDDPGFGQAASNAIVHDVTDGEVQWPGKDSASLRGKVVRLKFELRDAKLYAFRGASLVLASPPSIGIRHFPETVPLRESGMSFHFDASVSGWRGTDRVEHCASDGGYITAIRGGGLRPFAFLPPDAPNGLAGDWSKRFGGSGAKIAFQVRSATGGGGYQVELFAGDIAAWSFARFPKFTTGWQLAAADVRWDWNDAEAEAAGWVRGRAAFPWRETISHVGKVVIVAGDGSATASFDLDDFSIEPFADSM